MVFMMTIQLMLLLNRSLFSDNTSSIDLQVSAECLPHSKVEGYRDMSVAFQLLSSSQAAPTIQGTLTLDGSDHYEADLAEMNISKDHWVTLLFAGPKIEMTQYCDNVTTPHSLYMGYVPKQGFLVAMNHTAQFGGEELDSLGQMEKSHIPLNPEGLYLNEYRVGKDTQTPYWIEFSLSQKALESQGAETQVRYQFK